MKTQTERPKKEFGYLKPSDIGFFSYGAFYSVNANFDLLEHAICRRFGYIAEGAAFAYDCRIDFHYTERVVLVDEKYAEKIIRRLGRAGWKISHEGL